MHFLVDENIPFVEDFFLSLPDVSLTKLAGADFNNAQVQTADALLVRSVTQVNAALLKSSRVQFVGTATIGTDHLDTHFLQQAGIAYANAPGSNADSVVDYVLASLLLWVEENSKCLASQTVGVVGAGQVGGRLIQRLQAFGCKVLVNDPPLAHSPKALSESFSKTPAVNFSVNEKMQLIELPQLLEQADLVCLHTPLTSGGAFPSLNLVGLPELNLLRGKLLVNAGRGQVICPQALAQHLQEPNPASLILDVFASEPELDAALIEQCFLATPHIAGYSLDGKAKGTQMLYEAWCKFQGLPARLQARDFLPAPAVSSLELSPELSPQKACFLASQAVYAPRNDAWRLHKSLAALAANSDKNSSSVYQDLRKNYPVRREFSSLKVLSSCPKQNSALKALGFITLNHSKYKLNDLLEKCDATATMPKELSAWDTAKSCGKEI